MKLKLLIISIFVSITSFAQQSYFASAGIIDKDAKLYLDAALFTTSNARSVINAWFIDIKALGLYSGTVYAYPLACDDISSNANSIAQMQWNMKDPRNVNAAFFITYTGTPTGGKTGWTGGTGISGNTHAIPSTAFASNLNTNCIFISLITNVNAFQYDWGATDFSGGTINWYFRVANLNAEGSINTATSPDMTVSVSPTSVGLFALLRSTSTAEAIYKNANTTAIQTGAITSTALGPNQPHFLGGLNSGGTVVNPSTKRFSGLYAYKGALTTTQMAAYSNAINRLNKTMEITQGLTANSRSQY